MNQEWQKSQRPTEMLMQNAANTKMKSAVIASYILRISMLGWLARAPTLLMFFGTPSQLINPFFCICIVVHPSTLDPKERGHISSPKTNSVPLCTQNLMPTRDLCTLVCPTFHQAQQGHLWVWFNKSVQDPRLRFSLTRLLKRMQVRLLALPIIQILSRLQ